MNLSNFWHRDRDSTKEEIYKNTFSEFVILDRTMF